MIGLFTIQLRVTLSCCGFSMCHHGRQVGLGTGLRHLTKGKGDAAVRQDFSVRKTCRFPSLVTAPRSALCYNYRRRLPRDLAVRWTASRRREGNADTPFMNDPDQ